MKNKVEIKDYLGLFSIIESALFNSYIIVRNIITISNQTEYENRLTH